MANRAKRTYNLSTESVRRVRELAADYGVAATQDRVVEIAIDRLYRDELEAREAAQWAVAANDPDFRAELAQISEVMRDGEEWPR